MRKNWLCKLLKWEVPSSLPMRCFSETNDFCWEDWHKKMKLEHPIKYFILESFPLFWHVKVSRNIEEAWYWIKCHTYKKYHLLDLRQPDYKYGWADVREKIVFALFNLLQQYVDKELGGLEKAKEHLDWLKTIEEFPPEEQIRVVQKAIELYEWWNVDRINLIKEQEKANDDWYEKKNSEGDKERLTKTFELESEFEKTMDSKLKEIIDIRLGLWT